MNKLLLVVIVGLVALTGFEVTGTARPCRPGFPNCRRPPPPPPPPPPAIITTIYQRVEPAIPPANLDRTNLGRLLAGSLWTRAGSREQIRFVDSPGTGHFARPPRDRSIRAVMIDLVVDRHALFVNIDGSLYSVTACQMTTCLEHHDAGAAFGGARYGGR